MRLQTRNGAITKYGFACGYMEVMQKNHVTVTLWHEHGVYHVRAHNYDTHTRVFWDTFTTLADAKRRFRSA